MTADRTLEPILDESVPTPPPTPTRGAERRAHIPNDVQLCTALAVIALMIAVAGRLAGSEAPALIGTYGVLFLGIGAAPFQLLPRLQVWARLTAAVLAGLAVLLIVGALMADIDHLWRPVDWAIAVGAVAAALHLAGLVQLRSQGLRAAGLVTTIGTRLTANRARLMAASLALTVIGTALWVVPAASTLDPHPDTAGLLTVISPAWYAGLVVVIVAFVLGRRIGGCAGLATFSFGLATTLTPALVYAAPRVGTAGKQMELTRYVLVHHHIHVTGGIYQAFSALFAGVAWLCELLGIHGMIGPHSLIGLATYWPVMLVFLRIIVLRLLAGRILPGAARPWLAVMLVLLIDSLGQDYYSPQSVGYVIAFGACALAVRGIGAHASNPDPEPRRGWARPLSMSGTFWLLLAAGVALAPTHELSPYMAAGVLIVLALCRQAPRWAFLPIAVPALAWAGVVHHAISEKFSFSQLFSFANFRPPVTPATPGLHRLPIVSLQSHVLLAALLGLIVLAAIGFIANLRRGWAWGYGLSAGVGLALVAVTPYGNEGIFRAALFAIPWLVLLAVAMPHPGALLPAAIRRVTLSVATAALLVAFLGTFLVANYGMDAINVLSRSDTAVVDHLQAQPPRHAAVLGIGSEFNPAGYPPFTINYTALDWHDVDYGARIRSRHPTRGDLAALTYNIRLAASHYGAKRSSPIYILWTRGMLVYAKTYALLSPQQMRDWLKLLKASPDWKLVDRAGSSYLFKYRAVPRDRAAR